MTVLLYADVLGMKARWHQGVGVAERAFGELEELVRFALREVGPASLTGGGVQSDALVLTFDDVLDAVAVGRALFVSAASSHDEASRFWMRGVITELNRQTFTDEALVPGPPSVAVRRFGPDLLRAIHIEASFKGPRLLLDYLLWTQELRDALAVGVGALNVVAIRRFDNSGYPNTGEWLDVMWWLPTTLATFQDWERVMAGASQWLRRASRAATAGQAEELAHVAALLVAILETDAIIRGQAGRGGLPGMPGRLADV